MVGCIRRSADFERVLARKPCARSVHFAAHHLSACPSIARRKAAKPVVSKLSTADATTHPQPVDDSLAQAPTGCWLGTVVPKRHARRAVTRNLLKRQMRSVVAALAAQMPAGLWVLRLRSGFDPKRFASPASDGLRDGAREELLALLQRAMAPA